MAATADTSTEAPVRKSITVHTDAEHAFRVFTDDIDSWWPRQHHIGKVPMKRVFLEGKVGGRCYTEQTDGTRVEWGSVLVWDPPRRFVIAWQIGPGWQYEPDVAKSSEVEVRFTPDPGGFTRVDLEHRLFGRLGSAAAVMRAAVDSSGGWGDSLRLFAARAEQTK